MAMLCGMGAQARRTRLGFGRKDSTLSASMGVAQLGHRRGTAWMQAWHCLQAQMRLLRQGTAQCRGTCAGAMRAESGGVRMKIAESSCGTVRATCAGDVRA